MKCWRYTMKHWRFLWKIVKPIQWLLAIEPTKDVGFTNNKWTEMIANEHELEFDLYSGYQFARWHACFRHFPSFAIIFIIVYHFQ